MPTNRNRKSIRLKNYDYSQEGAYFVTICTHQRECLFGNIVNEQMHLNEIGKIVEQEWVKSAEIRSEIEIGEFVVMPNHMHGIVVINRRGDRPVGENIDNFDIGVGAYGHTPLRRESQSQNDIGFASPSRTLGAMVRGFKSASTKNINIMRNTPGLPVFQRGFHDHIIRDEPDYQRIYNYILSNPLKWQTDKYFHL